MVLCVGDAWYSSSLDFGDFLNGISGSHVHAFVTDVVQSSDTVDRASLAWLVPLLPRPHPIGRAKVAPHFTLAEISPAMFRLAEASC